MKTVKKYPYLFLLFLTAVSSGCATKFSAVERIPAAVPVFVSSPAGSLENPIVDSDISLSEALRKGGPVKFKKRQRLVEILYYSFDGKIHKGQLVIDARLVADIREVFRVALESKFPITSVIPISHDRFFKDGKWNEDDQSMLSNNTSAFNYRTVTGGKKLSKHAYGFAIDINPVQNPYIKGNVVLPPGAVYDTSKPGTLDADCPVVKTFLSLGWTWGGSWKSLKDYQHFEKCLPQKAAHPQKKGDLRCCIESLGRCSVIRAYLNVCFSFYFLAIIDVFGNIYIIIMSQFL